MNQFIQSWLLQSFVIFLIIGGLAGIVVGALLVLRPQSLQRTSNALNRWISTRHMERPLERSISLDPWFYRYRRTSGALILLGALYILYFFAMSMERDVTVRALANSFKLPSALIAALVDATALIAMLGALFAAFVSLFLLMRPSLLRGFEQRANKWVSLRRGMKPMEIPRANAEAFILQRSVPAGILLVLGGLYILVMLASWIGR